MRLTLTLTLTLVLGVEEYEKVCRRVRHSMVRNTHSNIDLEEGIVHKGAPTVEAIRVRVRVKFRAKEEGLVPKGPPTVESVLLEEPFDPLTP